MKQNIHKETYPEVIHKDNWDAYEIKDFNNASEYEQDYNNALEYQKKHGGEIYTIKDDWGNYVCYDKGKFIFDRLGYAVIKLIQNAKEGLKEK